MLEKMQGQKLKAYLKFSNGLSFYISGTFEIVGSYYRLIVRKNEFISFGKENVDSFSDREIVLNFS